MPRFYRSRLDKRLRKEMSREERQADRLKERHAERLVPMYESLLAGVMMIGRVAESVFVEDAATAIRIRDILTDKAEVLLRTIHENIKGSRVSFDASFVVMEGRDVVGKKSPRLLPWSVSMVTVVDVNGIAKGIFGKGAS